MSGSIVGLMGQKQSGKDTVASFLIEDHGFIRFALADALRDSLLALNPWVPSLMHEGRYERVSTIVAAVGWDIAKTRSFEIRRSLQALGTEAGRNIHGDDLWVDALERKIGEMGAWNKNVVITDVRFPNEAGWVLAHQGWIVRIDRPGLPDEDLHASEQAWRSVHPHRTFCNNGDLTYVRAFAADLAREVCK